MTQEIAARGSRQVEGFGTREVARQEANIASAQAQASAAVQAQYIMAMRNPRDPELVERELVLECQRPEFALCARYSRPVGGGTIAEGWSIRFAEAILRIAGNIQWTSQTIYEDADSAIWEFGVHDIQSNVHITEQATFSKTVERRNSKDREVIGKRTNSNGDTVYVVRATEEEMASKVKIARSKAWRATERLVRGDTLDRCLAEAAATIAALPPKKKIDLILQHFQQVGVTPIDVQQFVGHPIKRKVGQDFEYALSQEEIDDLISIGTAIRAKEITWQQVMAEKNPEGSKDQAEDIAKAKIDALKKAADEAQGIASEKPEQPKPEPPKSIEQEAAEFDKRQAEQQKEEGPRTRNFKL